MIRGLNRGRSKVFSVPNVQTISGAALSPSEWVSWVTSQGIKPPGHEADHSAPSSAEINNEPSYMSTLTSLFPASKGKISPFYLHVRFLFTKSYTFQDCFRKSFLLCCCKHLTITMFIQTLKHIRFTGLEHPSLASTLRQPESFQLYPEMWYHHFRGYDNTKCIRKESPSLGEER